MAIALTDIPEAATLSDCLRDHTPSLRCPWIVEGWRVRLLAWTAAEWAAISPEDRPPDVQPLGDLMVLLVLVGHSS